MNLEHVAINVPEPAAMSKWYAENLGMRIVMESNESPYMHFISDDAGSMLELYNNPTAPMPDYPNMNAFNFHIAFATDNIEAARERLVAAGATAGEITSPAVTNCSSCVIRGRSPSSLCNAVRR